MLKQHTVFKHIYANENGNIFSSIVKIGFFNDTTISKDKFNLLTPQHRPDGYIDVVIDATRKRQHRIVWECFHGVLTKSTNIMIDHINGDKSDNRLCNLRVASRSQNNANSKLSKRNKSGYKGVLWSKEKKKWRAEIRKDKKSKHLGYFDNILDAVKAYNKTAIEYFGEYALCNELPNLIISSANSD
jgi:hypothetical protein